LFYNVLAVWAAILGKLEVQNLGDGFGRYTDIQFRGGGSFTGISVAGPFAFHGLRLLM